MVTRTTLQQFFNDILQPKALKDYCPNGLQVEGKSEIRKLVAGVSACQALIDAAIAQQADAILVHHGYFWKGEKETLTGMKAKRIKALLTHDINLFAYHLPLDVHPEVGNNAMLAQQLGLTITGYLNENEMPGLLPYATLEQPVSAKALARTIGSALKREPLHIAREDDAIQTVAWCTGGADKFIEYAIEAGIDAFISGEVSEPTFHAAKENATHYFAAGHHATERYGVQALAAKCQETFPELKVSFVDIDNPV